MLDKKWTLNFFSPKLLKLSYLSESKSSCQSSMLIRILFWQNRAYYESDFDSITKSSGKCQRKKIIFFCRKMGRPNHMKTD